MKQAEYYLSEFESYLGTFKVPDSPANLYQPIVYILGLGGKRIRPVLTLMSCELMGREIKAALPAAMAIEVFHNFSLVHDDIMDEAPLRRGKSTVHSRWNINTGILSGDAMLITSYRLLESYKAVTYKALSSVFNSTAMAVCEGQQMDMDFESRDDVSLEEYLEMIEKKTAVLLGASMQMGAITAGADNEQQELCYKFGKDLGLAFQIQDDYLDVYGNPEIFGKQLGGDIIENKKTYLYLKTLESDDRDLQGQLKNLYADSGTESSEKVRKVKELYTQSGIASKTAAAIKLYTENAFAHLDAMNLPDGHKTIIQEFAHRLMARTA